MFMFWSGIGTWLCFSCVSRWVILSLLYKSGVFFYLYFFLLISTLNLYKGEEYLFVISLTTLFCVSY